MAPELYIPPCCIARQLPTLIHERGDHSFFYSRGDWAFPTLWNAISSLVNSGTDVQIMTVLVISTIDAYTLRTIAEYLGRGWTTAIALITSTDCTSIVQNELQPYIDRIVYLPSRPEASTSPGLWIRSRSDGKSLVVSGPMFNQVNISEQKVCQYTYSLTESRDRAIHAFQPWRSMIRISKSALRGSHPLFKHWL